MNTLRFCILILAGIIFTGCQNNKDTEDKFLKKTNLETEYYKASITINKFNNTSFTTEEHKNSSNITHTDVGGISESEVTYQIRGDLEFISKHLSSITTKTPSQKVEYVNEIKITFNSEEDKKKYFNEAFKSSFKQLKKFYDCITTNSKNVTGISVLLEDKDLLFSQNTSVSQELRQSGFVKEGVASKRELNEKALTFYNSPLDKVLKTLNNHTDSNPFKVSEEANISSIKMSISFPMPFKVDEVKDKFSAYGIKSVEKDDTLKTETCKLR